MFNLRIKRLLQTGLGVGALLLDLTAHADVVVVNLPGIPPFEAVPSHGIEAQEGQPYAVHGGGAGQNTFGGYTFDFANPTGTGGANAGPTGDFISGNNYGGVYFATGSVVTDTSAPAVYTVGTTSGNEYIVTSYDGPYFLGPPQASDTVRFSSLFAQNGVHEIPVNTLTQFGVGNGEYEAGYFYPGQGISNSTYTLALGGSTIAELVGGTAPPDPGLAENPVLALAGAFTATHDVLLNGDAAFPLVIDGGGSLTTANALLGGSINITGGTINGAKTVVANDVPSFFGPNAESGSGGQEVDHFASNTMVNVMGGSAVLNASTYLVVGLTTGTSTLKFSDGAQAHVGALYVGDGGAGSRGELTIDASTVTATSFIDVGEIAQGAGKLTISGGGTLSDTIAAIGFGQNANASATVTGAGSTWNNSGYVAVGYSGTSVTDTLTVTQGGQVNSQDFLVIGGQIQTGTSGNGVLQITQGGKVDSGTNVPGQSLAAAVGFGTNSTGVATIDGSGSSWKIEQRLNVGYSAGSTGTITVQNGGLLQVAGDIIRLGRVQGSSGTITFDGSQTNPLFIFAGSGDQFLIGDAGTGNLNVQSGARINETSAVIIGNAATGVGTANVSGINSSWSIDGALTVGLDGTGTLNISDGNSVTVSTGNVILGEDANSHGTLDLKGAGSNLMLMGSGATLVIGQDGTGNFVLESGATATLQTTRLGNSMSGHGTITVDGANSVLTVNGQIAVGAFSGADNSGVGLTNTMSITGGGKVISQGGAIATGTGSDGLVNIAGMGSTWDVGSSPLLVGQNGTGTLNISDHATADFSGLEAGSNTGTGIINVNGSSSGTQTTLTVENATTLGEFSTGTINANNGAQIKLGAIVDLGPNGQGNINLTDAKTLWTIANSVDIGNSGQGGVGTVMVQNGAGIVANQSTFFALNNGSVTVTGHGSSLHTIGTLEVGSLGAQSGSAAFNIQQGGQVTDVDLLNLSGTNSRITIDGKDPVSQAASTLHVREAQLLEGTSLSVQNGGMFIADQGNIVLAENIILSVTGGGQFNAANLEFRAQDTADVNVSSQGMLNTGDSTLLDTSVTTVSDGGTWKVQNGHTLTVRGGAALNVGSNDHGTVNVGGLTTIQDSGTHVTIDGGTMTTMGLMLTSNALVTVKEGGTLTVNASNMDGFDATIGSNLEVMDSGSTFTAPEVNVTNTLLVSSHGTVSVGSQLRVSAAGVLSVDNNSSVTVGSASQMSGTVHVGTFSSLTDYGLIVGNVFADIGSFVNGASPVNVSGSYINQGALTPGDDPGIFTVMGDFTQGPTGVLNIEVEGTVAGSPTGYGVLDVGGNAMLDGTLQLSFLNGFKPFAGEVLNFLNVTGTTSGAFSAVTLAGVPTLAITDSLVNGVLTINTVSRSYTNPTLAAQLTSNQRAVGGALNSVANGATGDLNTVLTSIDNLGTAQQVGLAFDQLSPQRLLLFRSVANDNYSFFTQQLDDHFANLRDGMTGLDTTGFSFSDPALGSSLSQIKGHLLAWLPAHTPGLLSDSSAALGGVTMSNASLTHQERFSAFINGNVTLADINSNADVPHSSYTTGGVTMGADYRINRQWTVGALFGYNHTDATLDNEGSNATVDTYSPGVYATFADKGWYANGVFNYGYNSYTANRNIIFPGINRTAVGTPDGNQYSTNLDGGYEMRAGGFTFGPSAGLNYVHLDINRFDETGAGAAGLSVQEQNSDSLRSRLGFDVRWQTSYLKTQFTYHLSAHWQHEFMNNSQSITSSVEAPGAAAFAVQGTGADRDSALIDTGLDVLAARNVDLYVDYQTLAGESNFFAQSVQAGVKIGF